MSKSSSSTNKKRLRILLVWLQETRLYRANPKTTILFVCHHRHNHVTRATAKNKSARAAWEGPGHSSEKVVYTPYKQTGTQSRFHVHSSSLLPWGYLQLPRYEHRWSEYPRLSLQNQSDSIVTVARTPRFLIYPLPHSCVFSPYAHISFDALTVSRL